MNNRKFKVGDMVTIVRDRQSHDNVCHFWKCGVRGVITKLFDNASPEFAVKVYSPEKGHPQIVGFADIERAEGRRLRWGVRPTYTKRPLQVRKYGLTFGYWPCLRAPFVSVALGRRYFDVWFGLPSYRTGGEA